MNKKVLIIFVCLLALGALGSQWDVVGAQGTIPDVVPVIPVTGGPIIASGLGHSCMTTADGKVLCWGLNLSGQVGNGTTTNQLKPVFVKDLVGVTNLSLGSRHSCALKTDRTIWCWGENTAGQLGNGSILNSSVPVQVLGLPGPTNNFTAGQNFTCAVLQDKNIWCWGENTNGQLNDGTIVNQGKAVKSAFAALPAQISGGQTGLVAEAAGQVSLWEKKEPITIWGLSDALNISGNRFAPGGCAVTGGSKVDCWTGDNKPSTVSGTDNALFVGAGLAHGCAIDINSIVVCWGTNTNGELGDGKNVNRSSGGPVVDLGPVTALAVGAQHNCVLIGDGNAMCWGNNAYGQLGNNTTVNSSVPVQVILPK